MTLVARDYDPSVGRWTTKDASRFGGGLNFYAYANNDPVNLVDPTGFAPGQAYPNFNDALRDAYSDARAKPWSGAWEYAGVFYQSPDGTFSYTDAQTLQDPLLSAPGDAPSGTRRIGDYHTHVCSSAATQDQFSIEDKRLAHFHQVPNYLFMRDGSIGIFAPTLLSSGTTPYPGASVPYRGSQPNCSGCSPFSIPFPAP